MDRPLRMSSRSNAIGVVRSEEQIAAIRERLAALAGE